MTSRFALFALFACSYVLVGCSPSAPAIDGAAAPADAAGAAASAAPAASGAPAADDKERFYGRESFTIVHELTGTEKGTVTEHVRDWGRTRAEITKSTMSIGPINQAKDLRLIVEGPKNTTVDNAAGTTTTMDNPFYTTFVEAMKGKDPMAFGEEFMRKMGGQKTGEKATIAGHECDYWTLMGAKTCVTPWGATLHTSTTMGSISIERKATEVRMGDGGPDSAFAYDASKAKAAPNVQDILKGVPGRN